MDLFKISEEGLLSIINKDRKKILTRDDIFKDEIKISLLKKIDMIFGKGLAFYADPFNLQKNKDESVFFRKDSFNAQLNLEAKKIVNKFEEEKISFNTLLKLSDFKLDRNLQLYKITDKPLVVANSIRATLQPKFSKDKKTFLKNLIHSFAEHNVIVLEFVESANKNVKANFNGFFLTPNFIVLKRNNYSREIFTLIHELGHYILNEEEIDENINNESIHSELNQIERWCNDFAYYFLVGEYYKQISSMSENDIDHDLIDSISEKTHISRLSIYTRLLNDKKISFSYYNSIRNEILANIKRNEEAEKARLEQDKLLGKPIFPPKPIVSPLYKDTLESALNVGIISEYEYYRKMAIR